MTKLRSNARWVRGFETIVDNGRDDAYMIDLPLDSGGGDFGATAIEMGLMSLSGCLATMFNLISSKMRLNFTLLEVRLEAEKKETIDKVRGSLRVRSTDTEEQLRRCFELAEKTCPVGLLYTRAGVQIDLSLKILRPDATPAAEPEPG